MQFSGTLIVSEHKTSTSGRRRTKVNITQGGFDVSRKISRRTITFHEGDEIENGPTGIHDALIAQEYTVDALPVYFHNYWADKEKTIRKQVLRAGTRCNPYAKR